jgi:LmbE family N-acetylglucosaminyl deacetylase
MTAPRALVLALAALSSWGCAGAPVGARGPSFAEVAAVRPRVLWVAAHPDDESMAAGVLASLCVKGGSACHFLVMNRGRGGECNLPQGCRPSLGAVRHGELVRAARLYRATLEHYDFYNAPLPVESFPSRPRLERIWRRQGDPAGLVARAVRRFRPDLVLSLDATQGFTGHPEHQAVARFALAGVRLAADAEARHPMLAGETPHRVAHVYHVQNKYWFMAMVGDPHDPAPHTDELDVDVSCGVQHDGVERSCTAIGARHTLVHRSQWSDMLAIRSANKFWGTAYLKRIDPFGPETDALVRELPAERGRDAR